MVSDGPHGLRAQPGAGDHVGLGGSLPATCFPTASAVASIWNPELLHRIGVALAQEARACRLSVILGPGINIKRSPLCGRNFEYFSEDPYLTGELGAGIVDGIQSLGRRHVGEALRREQPGDRPAAGGRPGRRTHLAGDLPAGVRTHRHPMPAVDDHVLLQQDQRDVGVGEPLAADHRPARGVGIPGAWWCPTGARSTTGCPRWPPAWTWRCRPTCPAARIGSLPPSQSGDLDERVLDARARTVLELVSRGMGVLELDEDFDADEHHRLARAAAAESIVLLKNSAGSCRSTRAAGSRSSASSPAPHGSRAPAAPRSTRPGSRTSSTS